MKKSSYVLSVCIFLRIMMSWQLYLPGVLFGLVVENHWNLRKPVPIGWGGTPSQMPVQKMDGLFKGWCLFKISYTEETETGRDAGRE